MIEVYLLKLTLFQDCQLPEFWKKLVIIAGEF